MRRRPNAQRKALSRIGLALAFLFVGTASRGAPPVYKVLSRAELLQKKAQPCTLIHVWATWCVPCIDELPKFLTFLSKHPKVTPVILDISEPYVQDQFSKKWLTQLAPPFTTYLKPGGKDKAYFSAIESPWANRLPYNALYDGGKLKGRWLGTQDFTKFGAELTRLCQ